MMIENMTIVDIIGFLAGIFISVSIVPQIVKSLKTKKVADISLLMLLILIGGEFLWIIYGIAISSYPIIAMDGFAFIATIIMLYVKIRYRQ